MFKLLIADDEINTRRGLRNCVNWADMEIEICGEAQNGRKALELASEMSPDIIISDVRMPLMDGIELCRELRALKKSIKIILISGYSDIDYLKSAIKMEAIDYILKPINIEELKSVVQKTLNLCREEIEQREYKYKMASKLKQSLPLLKERFFLTLVKGGGYTRKELEDKLEFMEVDFPVSTVCNTYVMQVDDYDARFGEETESDRQIISFGVLNIIQETMQNNQVRGLCFQTGKDEYVCIAAQEQCGGESFENQYHTMLDIKKYLDEYMQIKISIGVGREVNSLMDVWKSYKVACDAVRQKFFKGKNLILYSNDMEYETAEYSINSREICEKLSYALKSGNKEQVYEVIAQLFGKLSLNISTNIKQVQDICLQLILVSLNIMIELGENHQLIFRDISRDWEQILKTETMNEVEEYLLVKFEKLCEIINEKSISRNKVLTEKIKSIVAEKYPVDLTIQAIADEVYFSPAYISNLFKQNTGETINDYITSFRMKKAEELLKDYSMKLYEISQRVGYTDNKYFSRLFKKYSGMNPSEYREQLLAHKKTD